MHQQTNVDSVGLFQLQQLRQSLKAVANDNILRKKFKIEGMTVLLFRL